MKKVYASTIARYLTGLSLVAMAGAAQAQTFAPVVTYATGAIPQDIVTVDVNGDGRLDIITANSNSNNVGVLLGSATTPGTFPATATFYGSGGSFPVGLGVGDVNGDGRPDVVVDNASSNNVSVLLGSATTPGTFLAAVSYASGTAGPRGLGLTDLNGDGRLDIVMGGNSNIGVLLGSATTPGTFGTALTYNTGVAADGIAVGDVNGDGLPDVAVTGYQTTNTITILLNSAATPGTFPTPTAYGSGGVKPRGVTLADVNGDGLADIVAGNETSNTVVVVLNVAATPGTFGPTAMYSSGASGPDGVRVRDMNGDSRPDIVATNYNVSSGTTVSVLLNSATTLGTFATGTTYSSGGQGPVGLALGDLNNDGRPDIAATNVLSSTVGVLLNTSLFNAPTLTSINPTSGLVGISVTLTGTNLTGATGVSFNGTAATTFAVVNATTVTATVPTGATTGNVTVTTPVGTTGGVLFTVTYPDLVVSTTMTVAAGTYNNVTVTGTGNGTLAGDVVVNGALVVQNGGILSDGCHIFTGGGTFTLAAGGTLAICRPRGILAAGDPQGNIGAVRVTGGRSFSNDANYIYNGSDATGSGLPSQVRNLSIVVPGDVALTQPTSVVQALTLSSTGNLVLGGQALTLLSSSTGTALVVNSGLGTVTGTATVQRYLDPSLNAGPGYRHYSAPVSGSTVGDLATSSFAPVLTTSYNASTTPGTTTPFPTVFGYDQSRLATVTSNYSSFDKGFVVPAGTATPLAVGQGYAVNIAGTQLVDFVGTLTNGPQTVNLARNSGATAADAGWALVGNPYPAPIDFSLVAAGDRTGLDAAMYVFESNAQYTGSYRSFVNGVGTSSLIGSSQGFFVRVSTGQTAGALTFRNTQRVTSFATQVPVRRSTADVRPLVQLELRATTGPADVLFAYAETGATPAFDAQYDAVKLPNTTGLNLASLATTAEALAIDGRPAFTAATVLPLTVGVPAAGAYTFTAAALSNLPAGLDAYLSDAATGQTVDLSLQPSYAFTMTPAQAAATLTGRFTLHFGARSVLASTPALTAAEVTLYPNPAHDAFTVVVPAVAGASQVQGSLLNALGQVVRQQSAALPAAGARLAVDANGLAAGIYTLRLQVGAATLAKRVVIQ